MDDWRKIIRPPNAPVREYIFFKPPVPELKLKVTLSIPSKEFGSQSADLDHVNGQDSSFVFQPNTSALRPDAIFLPLFQRPGLDYKPEELQVSN